LQTFNANYLSTSVIFTVIIFVHYRRSVNITKPAWSVISSCSCQVLWKPVSRFRDRYGKRARTHRLSDGTGAVRNVFLKNKLTVTPQTMLRTKHWSAKLNDRHSARYYKANFVICLNYRIPRDIPATSSTSLFSGMTDCYSAGVSGRHFVRESVFGEMFSWSDRNSTFPHIIGQSLRFVNVYNVCSLYLHKFLLFLYIVLFRFAPSPCYSSVHTFLAAWRTPPLGGTPHDWKYIRPCVTVANFSYKAVSGFLITGLYICEEAFVLVLSCVPSV
jgi:hypothetical protein